MMEQSEPERIKQGRRINELCFAITREAMRRSQAQLGNIGLSIGAYNLLRALGERDDMTLADIRKILRVESATASTLLMRMQRDGLVEKAPSPTDKRASVLKATERANRLCLQADQIMSIEAVDITHGISTEEQAQIIGLLDRMLTNLDGRTKS
jgi:DNA-binding MarR family transcriptional regulator